MTRGRKSPAPRNVLMTTDAVGGVWTYGLDLAESLAARGVHVVLAVVGPSSKAQQPSSALIETIDTGLTLDWMAASPAEVRASAGALASLSRRLRPDVVHLNGPAMAVGGDFGAPIVGACHSCLPSWWRAVKGSEVMPEEIAWRANIQSDGMERCDRLIAPSRSFATTTTEVYGQRPVVVHNGRRSADILAAETSDAIFTAGRLWDEGKNLAVLDRAAELSGLVIEAAGPVQGPGGERVRLDHLRALGAVSADQVRAHLAARPIFVSTALYEPFGLAVLEAAQAGCPLVLADIPTFRELWSGAAVFVDPRDARKVAEALTTLRSHAAERMRLGAAAQRRAAVYTLDAMTEATLNVYSQVLGVAAEAAA